MKIDQQRGSNLINQILSNIKEKSPMQPVIIMMMPPGYNNNQYLPQYNALPPPPAPISAPPPSYPQFLPHNYGNNFVHRTTRKADRQIIRHAPYSKRGSKQKSQKASELVVLPNPLPDFIVPVTANDDLHCDVCRVNVNSKAQLKQHLNSTKHKMMEMGLIRRSNDAANPRVGQYKCSRCDVMLNSEAQLMQHLSSLRHQVGPANLTPPPVDSKKKEAACSSASELEIPQ